MSFRHALTGDAYDLRRDQLAAYESAMLRGDVVELRVGPAFAAYRFLAVFAPELAQHVLATKVDAYDKGVLAWMEYSRLFGHGLITLDGTAWRQRRRIVQPVFATPRVDGYVALFAEAAGKLVASWPERGEVDLHASAVRFALDALGVVFGEKVAGAAEIVQATVPVLNAYVTKRALSLLRLPASVPTPANRRALAARSALYGFIDDLIARRLNGPGVGNDLLSLLMTATDPETGAALDKDAVRDELVLFLLAGHETTAIALVSALHCVGADAEVQHRIRREVREVCGTRLPTATDLDSLPYTTAAVQEALRLYPPVHTLVRRATESDTLGGRAVPTGRVIAVNVWGLHRNSAVWRDPTRFDPGRFVGGQQQRYSFLPFGGGPHGCVGGRLAMRELVAAVATIVGAVELTPTAPLAVQAGLTVRPLGPVRAHVQRVLT